jgi:hypothetical protein
MAVKIGARPSRYYNFVAPRRRMRKVPDTRQGTPDFDW